MFTKIHTYELPSNLDPLTFSEWHASRYIIILLYNTWEKSPFSLPNSAEDEKEVSQMRTRPSWTLKGAKEPCFSSILAAPQNTSCVTSRSQKSQSGSSKTSTSLLGRSSPHLACSRSPSGPKDRWWRPLQPSKHSPNWWGKTVHWHWVQWKKHFKS